MNETRVGLAAGVALAFLGSALTGGSAGYLVAYNYKAPEVHVHPVVAIRQAGPQLQGNGDAPKKSDTLTKSDLPPYVPMQQVLTHAQLLRAATSWGDLDQSEVDALTASLKKIPHVPVTIFCEEDSKCGDMQLSFDNAFESAQWDTKLERPLIDDTIGVGTSSEALRKAIDEATHGRLAVKIVQKNAPYDVLVIGRKK